MKGRIVSNTGPIIALSTIDKLEILERLLDEVMVSEIVPHEILQGGRNFAGVVN